LLKIRAGMLLIRFPNSKNQYKVEYGELLQLTFSDFNVYLL